MILFIYMVLACEDSSLLGFFHSTGKWYIVYAALLGLVLILLVSIVCLCSKRRAEKGLVTF